MIKHYPTMFDSWNNDPYVRQLKSWPHICQVSMSISCLYECGLTVMNNSGRGLLGCDANIVASQPTSHDLNLYRL